MSFSPLPIGTVETLDGQIAETLTGIPWTRMNSDYEKNQALSDGITYFQLRCTPVGIVFDSNAQSRAVEVSVTIARRIAGTDAERATSVAEFSHDHSRLVDMAFWLGAADLIHEVDENNVESEEPSRVGRVMEAEVNARVILTRNA